MRPRLGTGFRTVLASWPSAETQWPSCLPAVGSVTSINSPPTGSRSRNLIYRRQCAVRGLRRDLRRGPQTRKLLGRGRLERRAWLVPRGLLVADLIGLSMAYVLTTLSWGEAGAFGSSREILVFLCTLPCWVIVAKLQGLYSSDQEQAAHSTADDVVGVFHLVTIGIWVLLVASRVGGRPNPSVFALITFWALAICIFPVFRTVARRVCKRSRAYAQNTLIVGAGEIGQLIAASSSGTRSTASTWSGSSTGIRRSGGPTCLSTSAFSAGRSACRRS